MNSFFDPKGLTGKTRHRSERRWGRERLILQVQSEGYLVSNIGGHIDSERSFAWRDATTADLTTVEAKPSTGDGEALRMNPNPTVKTVAP